MSKTYEEPDLLKSNVHKKDIESLLSTLRVLFKKLPEGAMLVWTWDDAPLIIRTVCALNGGDEDYVVVVDAPFADALPPWLERIGNDVDTYSFAHFAIYVGSHS